MAAAKEFKSTTRLGQNASLYTARYGAPAVGKKVYVQVNQFVNGWESLPATFSGIVPA